MALKSELSPNFWYTLSVYEIRFKNKSVEINKLWSVRIGKAKFWINEWMVEIHYFWISTTAIGTVYLLHIYFSCSLPFNTFFKISKFKLQNQWFLRLWFLLAEFGLDMFKCENGKTISMSLYCDFIDNCGDNSDEKDCGKSNL